MKSASKDFPDSFHRVSIKGICVRDGKMLLMQESKKRSDNKWALPGGGLDFGEDNRAALTREIKEEMGVEFSYISKVPVYIWSHKSLGRRGMEWFYSFVVCYEVGFEDLNIVPSDECEKVQFFSKEELADIPLGGPTSKIVEIFNPEDFKK